MWTFGAYGGVNPAGYTGSSLLWSYWAISFCVPGLDACLLSFIKVLISFIFLLSALVTLDCPSLTVRSGYRFLQSFFLSEIECHIDDKSLVLESLWF